MSLVLIDSSVWIDYYRPEGAEKLKSAVKEAIKSDIVAINGIIATEVLRGTADEQCFKKVRSDMQAFRELPIDWNIFMKAARFGFDLKHNGINIPTIDLLIATTAVEYKCTLWHQDNHFELIAEKAPLKTKNFGGI